jgi:hypothetical protein
MPRRLLLIAAAAALGTTAWTAVPSSAGELAPQMTISPTEGPAGTVIHVEGDGCVTDGATVVDVSLYDTNNDRQDEDEVAADEVGDWTAELTVPADTTDYGDWRVSALCMHDTAQAVAVPAQSPELFEYDDATFTVLAPEAPTTTTTTPPTTEPPAAQPVQQEVDFTG